MNLNNKLMRILGDHIEQMSKDLDKFSNGKENLIFHIYEKSLLINLCQKIREIIKKESMLLQMKGNCVVVGDICGNILDLYRIFTVFDIPPKTTYLFLGNLIGENGFNLEIITLLFVLKFLYPNNIYIILGSQESAPKSLKTQLDIIYGNNEIERTLSISDHQDESKFGDYLESGGLKSTYAFSIHIKINPHSISCDSRDVSINSFVNNDSSFFSHQSNTDIEDSQALPFSPIARKRSKCDTEDLYNEFCSTFSYFPLAAKFGEKILCLHGGIGSSFENVDRDLSKIQRPLENFDKVVEDILWSCPIFPEQEKEVKNASFTKSKDGKGCLFGKVSLDSFMKSNGLSLLIRSNDPVDSGVRVQFNNRIITVFSTSSLCGNKAGVIKVDEDLKVTTYSFPPFKQIKRESASFIYKDGVSQNGSIIESDATSDLFGNLE